MIDRIDVMSDWLYGLPDRGYDAFRRFMLVRVRGIPVLYFVVTLILLLEFFFIV